MIGALAGNSLVGLLANEIGEEKRALAEQTPGTLGNGLPGIGTGFGDQGPLVPYGGLVGAGLEALGGEDAKTGFNLGGLVGAGLSFL